MTAVPDDWFNSIDEDSYGQPGTSHDRWKYLEGMMATHQAQAAAIDLALTLKLLKSGESWTVSPSAEYRSEIIKRLLADAAARWTGDRCRC